MGFVDGSHGVAGLAGDSHAGNRFGVGHAGDSQAVADLAGDPQAGNHFGEGQQEGGRNEPCPVKTEADGLLVETIEGKNFEWYPILSG